MGRTMPDRAIALGWLLSTLILVMTSCNLQTVTPQGATPTVALTATADDLCDDAARLAGVIRQTMNATNRRHSSHLYGEK